MLWLIRRSVRAILLLAAVSALSFLLGRFAPGGFFDDLRLNPQIRPETIEQLRSRYGLDGPVVIQYGRWIGSAARGDLGTSLVWQQPVAPVLWRRCGYTLRLTSSACLLAWLLGLPLGLLAASHKSGLADRAGTTFSAVLIATPELLLLLGGLYVSLRTGRAGMVAGFGLPLLVLTATAFPPVFLHARSAAEDVLNAGFIRSARAHGIHGFRLWARYIFPAAANPLISMLGLSIGGLVGASLLVETVLSLPGLGSLFVDAISSRDLDVVTAVMLLSAAFLIAGNLLSDVLLVLNDPRIRHRPSHE